jgi:hypothetical protein
MKIIKENKLKENSLGKLKDKKLIDKIVEFLHSTPFPIDSDFHKFAKDQNIDPDELEEYVYAMLTVILCGGKSKGKPSKANEENIKIGEQIEKEHVEYETSDEVVKYIQEIFAKKILSDHTFETETYYVDGADFKKELELEK